MGTLMVHGTCVDIKGAGVLILGRSGSGKSSLAIQLIDRGATLIADDQTLLSREESKLIAHTPLKLRGILEVRGIGLCSFPYIEKTPLNLVVEITDKEESERLPDPLWIEYHGVKVPLLKLQKRDPLGAIKVELKLVTKDTDYVL